MKALNTLFGLCLVTIVGSFVMSVYTAVQHKQTKAEMESAPAALPAGQAPAQPSTGGIPVPASQ